MESWRKSMTSPGIWVVVTWILLTNLSEVSTQQQTFRRRPQPLEVKLGETAILQCEVENQGGQVQWTKDGFALGFLREIPGFDSRYSMAGDGSQGVHNLRIVNATLIDIAEYQCQVGPAKANKPIRSDAHLNVIVPPKSIELVNHAPDAKITLKERDQTELECLVREARPAASIIWFKNDKVLRMETREDTTEELEVVEMNVRVKKNTTRSKIRFVPTAEDDGAKFTCEARHAALPTNSPMRVSVYLSVQYLPGAPRIEGYREGELIRENQSVVLTCVSRGGNPLAELIWFRNDVRIDSSYSREIRESRNEYKFVAATRDNLAKYRCEATNSMSERPKIADVTLTVMFAPRDVKITGPTEAKIGDTVTFSCVTSPSNPRADIAWSKGAQTLDAAHTTTHISPEGGWTTSSNVSFKIESTDRTVLVTCQGINRDLVETKGATHMIDVIQPPGYPRIYRASSNVTEGQLQRVMCTSTGGHPKPELDWYRGSKKLKSTRKADGNTVTAEYTLNATRADNGVTLRCEATSKAIPSSQSLNETVSFHVLFPPANVSIRTEGLLKEGEKIRMTCEAAYSNPPATVTWWRDGVSIPAPTNESRDSKFGGKKVSTTLELELTSEFDNVVYTCQGMNNAVKKSVHDAITLQILYKPKFTETLGDKVTVVKGETKVLQVKAKGNPDKITYTWKKNGASLEKGGKGPLLNLTNVTEKDKGRYECTASNDVGSTTISVDLDVQRPATITVESEWALVGPGEPAHLSCQIDANPLEESMVEWTYGGGALANARAELKFRDNRSYLNIDGVTKEDEGWYSCRVDNGIGQPSNASIFLIVKHKPDIDLSPQIAKAASGIGETGKLICRAKGAPNVTFSWSKQGASITQDYRPSKYSTREQRVDMVTWESILEVKNVDIKDYGSYECIAKNSMGEEKHVITFNVSSIPETPLGLHVQNFTHDSVTLTWIPGFDGGSQQTFRIRYWKSDSDYLRTVDVSPRNTTVYTVAPLALGTEYSFSICAFNSLGESNYTAEIVRQETSSAGPNLYSTGSNGDYPTNPFSRLVISVFVIVGATMLIINVLLIACFLKRRSKKRLTAEYPLETQLSQLLSERQDLPQIIIISVSIIGTFLLILNIVVVTYFIYKKKSSSKSKQDEASEQGSSKSATIEMYAPSSYNETVTAETLSSISEKSATYSHGETHEEYNVDEDGKGPVSTYLVEQINHHSSSYPYREMGGLRASTLPRHPKLHGSPMDPHGHHEDDGYVDALRRNIYSTGVGDPMATYGRTTPRTLTRPPQVPPIPELYNIPPEARYVPFPPPQFGTRMGNGSIRHMSHSASQNMLNSALLSNGPSSLQANGRLVTINNGPLSPARSSSILTTFVPNPSPNNLEHEGHLV